MNLAQAIRSGFANYATFRGRARRSEFWFWQLFVFLMSLVWVVGLVIVAVIVESRDPLYFENGSTEYDGLFGVVGLLFLATVLVFFLPSLAIQCRRLHDTGRSGWWSLLGAIPFGGIVLLVWFCEDSGPGNAYGPSPKSSFAGYPGYGPPPYGQPQYGQPQYGQPQYGQPQYGQPPYGQPPYGPPGQPGYGPPPGQPGYGPPPGQPGYGPPPVQPGNSQSSRPGYGQPGSPSYGQYGQPGPAETTAPSGTQPSGGPPAYGTPPEHRHDGEEPPEPGGPQPPR